MCMIYGAETVTPIAEGRYVVAHKTHKCAECRREISAGEKYHTECFIDCNRAFVTHKTCAHCMVARDWLSAECGGWMYDMVLEDLDEHWPEHAGMRMGRIIVGSRRKWRWNGKLLPVPQMPEVTP